MGSIEFKPGNMLYPLPVVMVSLQRKGEKPNIITVGWTGTVCSDPAELFISVRPGRYSYDILKETKEFVVNVTTEELAYACDYCGVKSGRDVDKFKEMKLSCHESSVVACPGIEESPVRIECVVTDILPRGTHDMFIAKVVAVTADDKYLDKNGKFHFENTNPICYSHGEYRSVGRIIGKFGYSVKRKNNK